MNESETIKRSMDGIQAPEKPSEPIQEEKDTNSSNYYNWKKIGAIVTPPLLLASGLIYYTVFNKPENKTIENEPTQQIEVKETTNPESIEQQVDKSWEISDQKMENGNFANEMHEILYPNPDVKPEVVLDKVVDEVSKNTIALSFYNNFINRTIGRDESNDTTPDMLINKENGRSTEKAIQTKEFIDGLFDNKNEEYTTKVEYGQAPEDGINTFVIDRNSVGSSEVPTDNRNALIVTITRNRTEKIEGTEDTKEVKEINVFYILGVCVNPVAPAEKVEKFNKIIKITIKTTYTEKETETTPTTTLEAKDNSKNIVQEQETAKTITFKDGDTEANGIQPTETTVSNNQTNNETVAVEEEEEEEVEHEEVVEEVKIVEKEETKEKENKTKIIDDEAIKNL